MQQLYPINIVTGEDKLINLRLINQSDGSPYNLTNVSAMSTCFIKNDGTELELNLVSGISIVTALAGLAAVSLSAASSVDLATLQNQTLEVSITNSGLVTKVQIPNAYSVLDGLC